MGKTRWDTVSEMAISESIGERLLRLRKERGLSQRALATNGVTYAYISRIELGDRVPSMKALRLLAPRLGVSVNYLETGEEVPDTELRELRLGEAELALRLDGDTGASEAMLSDVLNEAAARGDARDVARARSGLGLAAAHRGDHDRAVALLELVIAESWVTPFTHPNVFATLGHSHVCAGRPAEGAKVLKSALAALLGARPLNAPTVVRFATYLSYALSDLGDLDGARAAINEAVRHTGLADDPYTAMRVYWSNARLASLSGDYDVARLSIDRAITLLEETEDRAHLGRAHLLAAEIAVEDDDLGAAVGHLDAAQTLVGPANNLQDRAWLRVQRALVSARNGDAAAAIDEATEAIELLGGDGDRTLRGCGHWALGEAYAAAGATSAARAAFRQASELIAPGSKYSERFVECWSRLFPADIAATA
jgi:transcriptional regulator with XRE-family HTH domain